MCKDKCIVTVKRELNIYVFIYIENQGNKYVEKER